MTARQFRGAATIVVGGFLMVVGSLQRHDPLLAGTISQPASFGPIWAKAAVSLWRPCDDSPALIAVKSPDGAASVEIPCSATTTTGEAVTLRIETPGRAPIDAIFQPEAGSDWRPEEVLWAPDSRAFLINGSESAYAGNDFVIYRVDGDTPTAIRVTAAAQRDMVSTFPPCKAVGADPDDCRLMARSPEFNMSAITWVRGSSAVVVFAEVPCSGSYGRILCQVMGYEVGVPSGHILARLSARELKRRYQSAMAWPMQIPPPPTYQ